MSDEIKLYTSDGHFVAKVKPMLPEPISEVVFWGVRTFTQTPEGRWIETVPTVVETVETRGPKP